MFKDLFGKNRRNRSALGFPDQDPDNRDSQEARRSPLGFGHDTASAVAGDKALGLFGDPRQAPKEKKENLGDKVTGLLDAMQRPQDIGATLQDLLKPEVAQPVSLRDIVVDKLKLNETVYNPSGLLNIVGLRRFTELQGGTTGAEIENLVRQSANGDLESTVQLLGEDRVREIGIENLPATNTEISNLLEPDKAAATGFSPTQVLKTSMKASVAALGDAKDSVTTEPDVSLATQQTTDPNAPGFVPPRSPISDVAFSNPNFTARLQEGNPDQDDANWLRQYADYWETYDPSGHHFIDAARASADAIEESLSGTDDDGTDDSGTDPVEGEIDEDPFQTLINFFGEPVPISRGTIIRSEFEPGSQEEIAAKGGVALSDRSAEADRINADTPGLQEPPEIQSPDLTAAIRFASQSIAGNPFISVGGLARMRRGLMPLLNQIDPQFWTRTSPTIVEGMRGLYQAVSVRAEDIDHIIREFKPPSLRG